MEATEFKSGDVVLHPRRREWGPGVVEKASRVQNDGSTAQRLVVTFKHHGRVTINTGVAPLIAEGSKRVMSRTDTTTVTSPSSKGWLASLEQQPNALWGLPENTADPFLTIEKRIENTLALYRFSTEARSLIDWAVAQTGVDDPLADNTRSELEQAFARFARDRDNHLKQLVREAKRERLDQFLKQALTKLKSPKIRSALQRAMAS